MAVLELVHPGGCGLHNAVVMVVCYISDKCTRQPLRLNYVVCWAREIREDSKAKQKKKKKVRLRKEDRYVESNGTPVVILKRNYENLW